MTLSLSLFLLPPFSPRLILMICLWTCPEKCSNSTSFWRWSRRSWWGRPSTCSKRWAKMTTTSSGRSTRPVSSLEWWRIHQTRPGLLNYSGENGRGSIVYVKSYRLQFWSCSLPLAWYQRLFCFCLVRVVIPNCYTMTMYLNLCTELNERILPTIIIIMF